MWALPQGAGGGGFEVSHLRVGNFAFQMGRKISHAKSRGFRKISRTLASDTVDSGEEGLFAACALHVYKPHFVLSIGVPPPPPSSGGPNLHRRRTASFSNPLPQDLLCRELRLLLPGGVSRIPPSQFKPMSAPETSLTLITGEVWQMGLPCIVSGTCG